MKPTRKPPTTRDYLVAMLSCHIGRHNGICARALAAALGVRERRLRVLITEAIEDGVAIVGDPTSGYYIAETAEDVSRSIDFHRSRARHELRKAGRLRRLVLPDLAGQLKLRT